MRLPLLWGVLLLCSFGACAKEEVIEVTPFTPTLNRQTHQAWFEYVRPSMDELGWTMWGWNPQLAPAARLASAENKPLLLWVENGHPLGSTSAAGIERREWWKNSNLTPSVIRFRVAADDLNALLNPREDGDPESDLAMSMLDQAPDGGSAIRENGGVLMASMGGLLLGSYSGSDVSELQEVLKSALEKWDELPREETRLEDLTTMVSSGRDAGAFPDDGLVLEVNRRELSADLDLNARRSQHYTHDYLWFSQLEIEPLVPSGIGQEIVVPEAQAQRIARFLLVNDLSGDSSVFDPSDILTARLSFKVISKVGDTIRFTASGEFSAASADQSGMRCVVEGMGSAKRSQGLISSLNLVGQAQSWGPEVERLEDGSWPLIGMSVNRAESFEGSHRITPAQFDQYPADWAVTE